MTDLESVVANSMRLSDRTKTIYQRAVRDFVAFAGALTGFEVERWRNHLAQTRKPQTVNNYMAGVRYASRRLAELSQNPQADFARYAETLKPGEAQERVALTPEQGQALTKACHGTEPADLRDYAICVLGLKTGLRRAGICGIQLSDLEANRLTVTLKGGKRHTISLDGEVLGALGPWIGWLEAQGITYGPLFRGLSRPGTDGSVAIYPSLSADGLYKIVKRRAKAAGIPGFYPHIFRHTFVSWCRLAGVPGHRISQMTGHKTDSMLDTYTTDLAADDNPVGSFLPPLGKSLLPGA